MRPGIYAIDVVMKGRAELLVCEVLAANFELGDGVGVVGPRDGGVKVGADFGVGHFVLRGGDLDHVDVLLFLVRGKKYSSGTRRSKAQRVPFELVADVGRARIEGADVADGALDLSIIEHHPRGVRLIGVRHCVSREIHAVISCALNGVDDLLAL